MKRWWWISLAALVLAAGYVAGVFLRREMQSREFEDRAGQRPAPSPSELERLYASGRVKIIAFYTPSGYLMEDEPTTLCYGVVNARSVRLEPPLEPLSPSLNRCIALTPKRDAVYTLVAEGHDGQLVSESCRVKTFPDAARLPKVQSFRIERTEYDRGRPIFLLSFSVINPEEVSIEPRAFPPLSRAPYGRFYVSPEKTTTYTLTVTGHNGHTVRQELTVPVP
ncbi:MAG: hypothetical protein MUC42_01990 [Bryobacter sp.]|jgi:hypothetical protein|nr:hypothetical protein [Bryobacter sp.]